MGGGLREIFSRALNKCKKSAGASPNGTLRGDHRLKTVSRIIDELIQVLASDFFPTPEKSQLTLKIF